MAVAFSGARIPWTRKATTETAPSARGVTIIPALPTFTVNPPVELGGI